MIGYCAIVALLAIYSHRTNATRFINNTNLISDQLLDEKPRKFQSVDTFSIDRIVAPFDLKFCTRVENVRSLGKTFSRSCSGSDLIDTVCDKLTADKKRLLCDEFMRNIILKKHGDVFESFSETPASLTVPQIAVSASYRCEKQMIGPLNMEKRMYWCESRRYNKKNSDDFDEEQGFFVAGSRHRGCTFAFRPPETDSDTVSPVAKMEYVELIVQAVHRANRSPL